MEILVGCCGFTRAMKSYMKDFRLVELQTTFYRVVRPETARKWRTMAPEEFIFTVKAFQGITHNMSSPTWRRSNIKPNANHGELRTTKEVLESWRITKMVCDELKSPFCLIQTPGSFRDSPKNIQNAESFFTSIDRGSLEIGLEARGWSRESIEALCKKAQLIHVTDPFLQDPVTIGQKKTIYLRLHGSPPGKKMYSYSYTDEDLMKLLRKIESYGGERVYVLFNNVSMERDAKRFIKLLNP